MPLGLRETDWGGDLPPQPGMRKRKGTEKERKQHSNDSK